MTITVERPTPQAATASPYTPISFTTLGVPVYSAQGGRSGGGIQFIVGDDDGADPDFDDERDDDDDDDEDDDDAGQDDEPAARRATRRRGQRDNDDEADGDDDGDTDWTPPTREAWERLTTAHKRANAEAGKRRRIGKVADKLGIDDFATWLTERGIDPETGRPYGDDVVDPGDDADLVDEPAARDDERTRRQRDKEQARALLTAERRGEQKAREQLMPVLAEHAARLALRDAGFNGDDRQLRRIMRTIDPDELDLDLDGDSFELIGIEEAVATLQEDFPELFEERKPARRRSAATATRGTARATRGARDVDGGGRGRQQAVPKTWQEKILSQMVDRGQV